MPYLTWEQISDVRHAVLSAKRVLITRGVSPIDGHIRYLDGLIDTLNKIIEEVDDGRMD